MSGLSVVTPPASEPVTLAEVRGQLRLTGNDEDGLLAGYLLAARSYVEDWTGRALLSQTLAAKFDWAWPTECGSRCIVLPRPPLVSVASVQYVDTNGATQTLSAGQYQVVNGEIFGYIVPAYGVSWPSVRSQPDAVTVQYVAGYGSALGAIPEPIRQAILLLTSHFYENREPVVTGTIATPLPMSVEALLSSYRTVLL